MATIKTAIALYDGVMSPLKAMHRVLTTVVESFEKIQSVSRTSIDTSAIQNAKDELTKIESAFDRIQDSIRGAGGEQESFTRNIQDSSSTVDGLWKKLKGVAAALGGGRSPQSWPDFRIR